MPLPTPTLANVVVGEATVYTAVVGTAQPADTVLYGTAWSSPWSYIGATTGGIMFNVNKNTQDITIEEQSNPAGVTVVSSDFQVVAELSEDTIASMKLAYGGSTVTVTAPGVGAIGKSVLTFSDTVPVLALGFDGVNPYGFFRRVFIPQVISVGTVGTPYRRAAGQRVYPVTFRAICAPSSVSITEMTAVSS